MFDYWFTINILSDQKKKLQDWLINTKIRTKNYNSTNLFIKFRDYSCIVIGGGSLVVTCE